MTMCTSDTYSWCAFLMRAGIAMVKRKSKSCSEIKKKKQRNAYEHAQSLSCDEEFWDKEQQEMYLQIYKKAEVFAHRSVHLSDNIDTKYEKLGLKGMLSNSSTWK